MEDEKLKPEVSDQSLVTFGSYYIDKNNSIVNVRRPPTDNLVYIDHSLPYEGRVERVDYKIVKPIDGNVEVAILGGIHADEEEAPTILNGLLANNYSPRVEALNVHIAAAVLGTRDYVRPLRRGETKENLEQLKPPEYIEMVNGREVVRGGVAGRKINLNRQFHLRDVNKSYDEVIASLDYPEAKLLIKLLQDNPDLRYLFSIHEDPEFGFDDEKTYKQQMGKETLHSRDGFYFYDCLDDGEKDHDKELVSKLHIRLIDKLTQHGFTLLDGIDDPNDPDLCLKADRGYIYQPNVKPSGNRKLDGTIESAVVELNRLGIGKIERAFSFEIPKGLSTERKSLLLQLILSEFIVPFLQTKGIDFHV